jgi:predicted NBD/HSP70 family sugar kinase
MAHTNDRAGPAKPLTLAIDIGGSHLKAAVLNASGKMSTDPVRVKTPKPATPDAVVAALIGLSQQPLCANDDETNTCREFTREGIGQTSSGNAPNQRQEDPSCVA